jgi:hypothetical protein
VTTAEAVRHEERDAWRHQREAERLARFGRAVASRRRRESIAQAIREAPADKHCRCALRAGMGDDDLSALGAGCTAPRYVCPRLDAVRRRVGL